MMYHANSYVEFVDGMQPERELSQLNKFKMRNAYASISVDILLSILRCVFLNALKYETN